MFINSCFVLRTVKDLRFLFYLQANKLVRHSFVDTYQRQILVSDKGQISLVSGSLTLTAITVSRDYHFLASTPQLQFLEVKQ